MLDEADLLDRIEPGREEFLLVLPPPDRPTTRRDELGLETGPTMPPLVSEGDVFGRGMFGMVFLGELLDPPEDLGTLIGPTIPPLVSRRVGVGLLITLRTFFGFGLGLFLGFGTGPIRGIV